MTSFIFAAAVLAAFLVLIWRLGRLAEQKGEQGVRDAVNTDALETLNDANEVENTVDGMSRDDVERVLRGPQEGSD